MKDRSTTTEELAEASPKTLGDVLYAKSPSLVLEQEWVALVRDIARKDQLALHALYERAHRIVFTLIMRIIATRETAAEITSDVSPDVWRRAARYDAASGTVLGWIMMQARSRAIDRLRYDGRKKRDGGEDAKPGAEPLYYAPDAVELRQRAKSLQAALAVLTSDERQAIELTFLQGMTHAEASVRLNQPLGTVKTRIRSALQKLRRALATEPRTP
jgi:RNA polymerase sigma-70 factor (ECF subfamily)